MDYSEWLLPVDSEGKKDRDGMYGGRGFGCLASKMRWLDRCCVSNHTSPTSAGESYNSIRS
jgi:hypothetical protein